MIKKLRDHKLILVEVPLHDEISGLAVSKILDYAKHTNMMFNVKFERNLPS